MQKTAILHIWINILFDYITKKNQCQENNAKNMRNNGKNMNAKNCNLAKNVT